MTFFNKKTDVIDIELTPYGRYLLSIGKLKPKYYDFTDDDILYDISADGTSKESNEKAHNRIVSDTPKLKVLTLKKGVESDAQASFGSAVEMNKNIDSVRIMNQEVSYNQRDLMPLGKSSYSSQVLPNFQATMLQGEITSSVHYLSSSNLGETIVDSLPIPQIDIDFVITATIGSQLLEPAELQDFTSQLFNGEYVKLTFENPIIHLKEFGSFYEKENFDIEVYELNDYEYSTKIGGPLSINHITGQSMTPKKFIIEPKTIVNDMLVDSPQSIFGAPTPLSKEMVQYYFDIEVDQEISREELCSVIQKLEVNDQFIDEELICPDARTEQFDIYKSRVSPDDLEDCD